jgi:CBS domain-containing protein
MLNMTATSIGEVMTPHPVTVSSDTTVAEALCAMDAGHRYR